MVGVSGPFGFGGCLGARDVYVFLVCDHVWFFFVLSGVVWVSALPGFGPVTFFHVKNT